MISGSKLKFKTGCILTALTLMLLSSSAFSATNSVSEVNVRQNSDGHYQILLKTDKSAKIRTSADGDRLLVSVASAVPASGAEIIYDNAPGIQNVTVQNKNDENTLIVLQGQNVRDAQVFNKDLSTGQTLPVDNKALVFFVADKKLLAYSLLSVMLLFMVSLFSRPKERMYSQTLTANNPETNKRNGNITLRQKAMLQSSNIPSVNYKMSGSFLSSAMSAPSDFVVASDNFLEEKIRKAG